MDANIRNDAIKAPPSALPRPAVALRSFVARPDFPAIVFLIVLSGVLLLTTSSFGSVSNIENLLKSAVVLSIVAVGVNLVMLAGEIDISVGSVLGLSAICAAHVSMSVGGLLLPAVTAVVVGALAGALNGVLVARVGIPSVVVTLAALYAWRGVDMIVSGGSLITPIPDAAASLGKSWAIPFTLLVLVVLLIISRNAVWYRNLVATGNNAQASLLAGLPIRRIRTLAFILSGAFTGLAALIYMGQVGGVAPTAGNGLELQAIAAVVLGGTSIAGGRGTVTGPFLGALIITLVNNAMVLWRVPNLWQSAFLGVLIIAAIAIDAARRRTQGGVKR